MRAVLKECLRGRLGDDLVVIFDPREAIVLADANGQVEALLDELSRNPGTTAEICANLAKSGSQVTEAEVDAAIGGLDSLGLVEDGDGLWLGSPELDARHTSNLAFFSGYATTARARSTFVRKLRSSHVLMLGVGGVASNVLMCLVGLGVGRLTIVDYDTVESRNFARQFVYRHADIGRSKVDRAAEWIGQYDPFIEVRAVNRRISTPDDLVDVVGDGVDLVVAGIDQPPDAPLWVNDAAVRSGVPLVASGIGRSQVGYYSVDPGRSPCRRCDVGDMPGPDEVTALAIGRRLFREQPMTNTLIGPLAMQIASLVAYEALRYLTGFEPPYAAGAHVVLDLRAGLQPRREPFTADPDCPSCALAPARLGAGPVTELSAGPG